MGSEMCIRDRALSLEKGTVVLLLEKGAYPKNSHVRSFKPFMCLDLDVCACCAQKGGTQAALITDTDCTNTSALINESRVQVRSRGGR